MVRVLLRTSPGVFRPLRRVARPGPDRIPGPRVREPAHRVQGAGFVTFGRYTLAPGPEWTDLAASWPLRYVIRMTDRGHWLTDVVHPELSGLSIAQAHLVCARCEA